ncbi:MAG: hypothetical protein JWR32_5294 [Mycobacterium sp.]|nr:hypothetical protein [Mycobacterium sp.]
MVATIDVGGFPHDLAVSPDGRHVYLAGNDGLSVIDTSTNSVVETIAIADHGNTLGGVAVSPDGAFAYVTNNSANTLSILNTSTNTVAFTVPVGRGPWHVVINPNGARAYIVNIGAGTLSVVNTVDRVVLVNVDITTTQRGPAQLAVSPSGGRVYVANNFDNTLSVISGSASSIEKTIKLEAPNGVAASRDRVYVTQDLGGVTPRNVTVLDPHANHNVIGTVAVGARPSGMAVSPDGTRLYVANTDDDTVSVVDTASDAAIDTIAVGHTPLEVAVSPDSTRVYVINQSDSAVSVIAAESVASGP